MTEIHMSAHHAAWKTETGIFISCCWGRGKEWTPQEVSGVIRQLTNAPPGNCCAELFRRISACGWIDSLSSGKDQ